MSAATVMPQPASATVAAGAPPAQVGTREWLGFFVMIFGMFMAILDIQIVASSLSEIQAGLSASADEISWVQTSYLIAEVIMIPLSGFLSRLLSTRVLFVASAFGFTLMSVACAFTTSIGTMIVFRALQGFIGGAMIPTVFATSFIIFPPAKRAAVSVMIGLVATMAPTIGPTLGGYLTQSLSWHWLFLINVIPGLFVTGAVWALVDIDRPDRSLLKGFDYAGIAFMALFLGSLEYVMEEGPRNDWFDDRAIFTLAVIAVSAAVLFFWRAFTARNPIVELRAFADRNFALGCLYSFIIGVGLYGAVYVTPLFLARVRGFDSLQIGLIMMVTGLFQFTFAPVAGALSKKLDLRVMLALGLLLFGLGLYTQSGLTAEAGYWELFLPQALRGASLMLCFIPINTLALGTLPPDKLKNASGLYNLMRNLGGAIGLAAINTALIDRGALHWSRLVDSVNPARPAVNAFIQSTTQHYQGMISGDAHQATMQTLARMVEHQATVMTFNDTLLLMALAFVSGLVLTPLIRKPKQVVAAGH